MVSIASTQVVPPAAPVQPNPVTASDSAPVAVAMVVESASAVPAASSSAQATVEGSANAVSEPNANSSAAGGRSASGTLAGGSASGLAAAALADGSEIVFGVPIEDNGMLKIMRRVIVLAAIGATFYITHFIGNLMRGAYSSPSSGDSSSLWTAISSLLIELSIPACGYYGALHSNRQLTCCFCSCNLFVTIVSIMSFIRLHIRIGELDGHCERERNSHQRRTCEVWTSDGAEKYMMVCSTILVICLGCLAFWFGNSLYQRLAQEFTSSGVSHVTLVGEVISLSSLPGARGSSPGAPGTSSGGGSTAAAVSLIPLSALEPISVGDAPAGAEVLTGPAAGVNAESVPSQPSTDLSDTAARASADANMASNAMPGGLEAPSRGPAGDASAERRETSGQEQL